MYNSDNEYIGLYEELFIRYFKPLCAFVYSYIPDIETVKDIVQDTFASLWSKRDRYSPTTTLLYTVAKNKTLDHLKANPQTKRLKGIAMDAFIDIVQAGGREEFDEKEIVDRVWEFVEELPPRCKKIFIMSRRDELRNKEIAEKLDISVKAVEKQITKANLLIREHLLKNGILALVIWLLMFPE
jgi:RNA polymerase sigma-70 factor (ECF subfamily)